MSIVEENLNRVYRTTSPNGATIHWEQGQEEYILRDGNRYYVHSSRDRQELVDELTRWKMIWDEQIKQDVFGQQKTEIELVGKQRKP